MPVDCFVVVSDEVCSVYSVVVPLLCPETLSRIYTQFVHSYILKA